MQRKTARDPFVIWFTGLPCSGKSTLSERVFREISEKGYRVEHLDGDAVRAVLPATGFTRQERDDHIKRIGFMAALLERNGVITVCSFVSPYRDAREKVRSMCRNFIEVHVATSKEECEKRDVKGMYARARKGEIKNFTGVDDPYEPPVSPELFIDAEDLSVEASMELLRDTVNKYL